MGVTPLVVIPSKYFDKLAVDNPGHPRVENGRMWISDNVCRNNGILCVLDDIFQFTFGYALKQIVHIFHTHIFFQLRTRKSVMDPQLTGTRIAMPSNFPFRSGMTSVTAFAAPVVVGIILVAAARARRRSLCGASCTC